MESGSRTDRDALRKCVVSNTSPLIALGRIDHLHLLKDLFGIIRIPSAVRAEAGDDFELPEWIAVEGVDPAKSSVLHAKSLGKGEKEAIDLALQVNADLLILDDRSARKEASGLGIQVLGTAGLLVIAKRHQLIPDVRPLLEATIVNGLYVDERLCQKILELAGE